MKRAMFACVSIFALALGCQKKVDISPQRGHELYLSYGCAACHGQGGAGDGPGAAAAMIKPRDLRAGAAFVGGSSVDAIAATISSGMLTTGMPGYPELPLDERRAIAAWIRSIQKEKP